MPDEQRRALGWDFPFMSATFARATDAVVNFRRPTSCRRAPMRFESAGLDPSIDKAKWDKLMRHLNLDPSKVDVSFCDDLPPEIRGAFWTESDGRSVLVLNSATASDNTLAHESYHLAQEQHTIYRPWRLGYEASAMRWADAHEHEYQGILRKPRY